MYTPKFKRGDWIKSKNHGRIARVVSLLVECYGLETIDGEGWWLDYDYQDNWEITSNPNKESGSSEIPNDLEEAAMNYIAPIENDEGLDYINFNGRDIKDAFIAGAEWKENKTDQLPNELEEAAEGYGKKKHPMTITGAKESKEDFIAGAKWQAEQLLKGSPLPEDTVLFNKGVAEGKRLMMEEAVEGKVAERVQGKLYARCQVPKTMGVEFGDKVRVIVIPNTDEK